MVKARSSLFFITFVIWWLTGVSCSTLLILSTPDPRISEPWRANGALVERLSHISLVLAICFATVGLCFLAVELFIRAGWEPRFLEVFRPGCEIVEKEILPGGKSRAFVRFPSGVVETFEADRFETDELIPGSVCHLWVIGQHISRIRVIDPNVNPAPLARWERLAIRPDRNSLRSWLTILGTFFLSSYFVGLGLIVMFGHSFILTPYKRRSWDRERPNPILYEGTEASLLGLSFAIGGIALLAYVIYLWKKGWDESTLGVDEQYWHDSPPWWRGRWW